MEETSGTRTDSHGSNDLTDNNTVGSGTGIQGNGADFEDSNSEYFTAADSASLDITGDLSISMWINPESITADHFLLCKGDVNSGTRDVAYWFQLYLGGGMRLRVSDDGTLSGGSNLTMSTTTTPVSTSGSMQHIAVTYDASTQTGIFYHNGVMLTTSNSGTVGSSINNSTDALYIGARETNGSSQSEYDGIMDEVGLWSRVLTEGEIQALYNSGSGIPYEDAGGTGGANNAIFFGGGV